MFSKVSQSEISPALPDATAPPLTHAESVCPMTKPTVTVPTVTTMAIDTATTAMALIKFPLATNRLLCHKVTPVAQRAVRIPLM